MRRLILGLLGLAILLSSSFSKAEDLLSYRDWKNEKMHLAERNMKKLNQRLVHAKTEADSSEIKQIQQDLSQEKWNLDISKELSITDYFAIYVLNKSQSDYKKIAQKMSPTEVAELMAAYAHNMASSEKPIRSRELPIMASEGPR